MRLGLGVAAGPDPTVLVEVAPGAEGLGFESAWCNDSPAGEGLAQLNAWAALTEHIGLGVGVLALDRHSPESIADRVKELGLPPDRLWLGIGAGFSDHPLAAVRVGVARVRELLPGVTIAVAAMRPRMCELAGEIGDGVLLNWMTPGHARLARERVAAGIKRAGRAAGSVTIRGYVRVALGDDARDRLAREATFYTRLPHYARHFAEMGVEPLTIGVAAGTEAELLAGIREYDALDSVVTRVLSERTPAAILAVATAAAAAI